jgi:NADH dehydrogenase FAD-containing subunit
MLQGAVSITLVETQDHLLSAYDRQIAEYASTLFKREGINLKLNTK